MSTGFRINNQELYEIYENFPADIAELYNVTPSAFSNEENRFLKCEMSLIDSHGIIFPTSANENCGGYNESNYRVNSVPIDVALKGCRPIGIPLVRLESGTHYINRIGNETWLSVLPNSASGTRLEYDPKYLHIEALGGGGGGGGSATMYASAGGGGGGYCYLSVAIPEESYITLVVGEKGRGGDARTKGNNGGDSKVLDYYGNVLCCACGGSGGGINAEDGGKGGESYGGLTNIYGGAGGKKENNGQNVSDVSFLIDKPENERWIRGDNSGGISRGNNFGGGGGACAFNQGANADSNTTPNAASFGGGGAGAGFKVLTASNGGDGGNGFINIYY